MARLTKLALPPLMLALGFGLGLVLGFAPGATAQPVDLELSLLLDSSISVTDEQFAIQIDAVADLVEDPAVIPQDGSVALNLVLYATRGVEAIPFALIGSPSDAAALAAAIRAVPRECCRTGIATGLRVATASILSNGFEGRRKIIDVAGNGVENGGARLDLARADALLVVDAIHGLPVTAGTPDLLRYYQDEVIGGIDAFAYDVRDGDDFAAALRAKLLREIGRCAPPLEGLVAWWAFDRQQPDVECDVAAAHAHAAMRLGCPAREPGRFGDALVFDGIDDALIVPAADEFSGAAGLTAVAWVRTLASSGEAVLFDARDQGGLGWRLSIQDGTPRVIAAAPGEIAEIRASAGIADGAWHHVGFTLGAQLPAWHVELFVDGVSVGAARLAQPLPGAAARIIVGADALPGASARFAGSLDDAQVFGRALSSALMAALANPPVGGQCGWVPGCAGSAFEREVCLWPPSHEHACFADARVLLGDIPVAAGVPVHVIDCRSSQPDDMGGARTAPRYWRHFRGDGATADDCLVAADGLSFCVRAERAGASRFGGREYTVLLTLDCGGGYPYSTVRLRVPHDMRERAACDLTARPASRPARGGR